MDTLVGKVAEVVAQAGIESLDYAAVAAAVDRRLGMRWLSVWNDLSLEERWQVSALAVQTAQASQGFWDQFEPSNEDQLLLRVAQ